MNFSFTDIGSEWLGLLIKCIFCLSDLYKLHHKNNRWMLAKPNKMKVDIEHCLEKLMTDWIVKFIYPAVTRSTWKALLDCSISSQTEFAKVFPRDWNKLITEGSHTLTSNVRDLTYTIAEVSRKHLECRKQQELLTTEISLSKTKGTTEWKALLLAILCTNPINF